MIYHTPSDYAPTWRCRPCEVGWSSTWIWRCWNCGRRGEPGDVRGLVSTWVKAAA